MTEDQAFDTCAYAVMAAAVVIIAFKVAFKHWGGPHAR